MRNLFLRALCAALSLTLALGVARAEEQTVDMTKWITLTVKQGEEIKLSFAASAGDVWVKVTGVEDEKIEKAPTQLPSLQKYKATGTEITIFGAIDQFVCSNNYELLTAINEYEHTTNEIRLRPKSTHDTGREQECKSDEIRLLPQSTISTGRKQECKSDGIILRPKSTHDTGRKQECQADTFLL